MNQHFVIFFFGTYKIHFSCRFWSNISLCKGLVSFESCRVSEGPEAESPSPGSTECGDSQHHGEIIGKYIKALEKR